VDGECVESSSAVESMNFNLTSGILSELTMVHGSLTGAETTNVNINGEVISTKEFNLTKSDSGLSSDSMEISINLPHLVTETQRATISGQFSMSPYSFKYESTNNLGDGHLYTYTDPKLTICDKAEIDHDSCRETSGLNFTVSLTIDPKAYTDIYSWLSPNTEVPAVDNKFIFLTYHVERTPIGSHVNSLPDIRVSIFSFKISFNANILLPPE
jgi:hypothetical protein